MTMLKQANIITELVNLLENSQTTALKLYKFVNGEGTNPTKQEFEKFRKELINSIKRKKENALQLFPIIKYFESNRLSEEDLQNDGTLFTVPSDEKIAIASPIEVLEEFPQPEDYDLSILWDLSSIEERETQLFKAVENYFNLVKDDENLKKFIRMIGTFMQENLEIEKNEKELFLENIPQETFALYQSSDLNNLIPNEIAQLDDPELEIIFLKNFIEQKLLTYQLWGIEREIQEEWVIKQRDIGERGPLFICLDTSGSMRNMKEVLSKALTLVFVRELEKMDINVVFIPFSMEAKFYDLYDSKFKLKSVKMNLRKSFYGGSDIEKLVDLIDSVIYKKKYERANILIMSDFIFKKLPKKAVNKLKKLKHNGHKLHSLTISDQIYKNNLFDIFNTNWRYTFNWKTDDGSIEEEFINELSEASTMSAEVMNTIQSFGIINLIKSHDKAEENAQNLAEALNRKLRGEDVATSPIVNSSTTAPDEDDFESADN
ncbi:conserved hypothetical protein [Malacoplasma penetrans HF-2]|uniref:VWFA domain-containing protein n=2 Tax=Malacoplasma penetrans TaxID=28227 RepID=Q8EW10_MALP2|nr:conserved hypothetical protein [Malacoplasma penetrans HF-2]